MAFNWTHDPLIAGESLIYAGDYIELQTAVDIVRAKAHMDPITDWFHIEPMNLIKTIETQQIRDAIDSIDPDTAGCTTDNIVDQTNKFQTHRSSNNASDFSSFPGSDDSSLCAADNGSNRAVHRGSVNSSYRSKDDVPWHDYY